VKARVFTLRLDAERRALDDGELAAFLEERQRHARPCRLRLLARSNGVEGGRHAAVTVVQRAGGVLNLNVHFHSLVADGVWVEGLGGVPRFVHVRVDPEDVAAVARKVERKVCRLLAKRGLPPGDEAGEQAAEDEADPDRRGQLVLLATDPPR
jgi:hypothetical protein